MIGELPDKKVIDNLSNETNRIETKNWLNDHSSNFAGIKDLVFDITYKNERTFLLFKFTDYENNVCKGGIEIVKGLKKTLIDITSYIHNGQLAIKYLNNKLADIQAENGLTLEVKYKWGISNHAHIVNWSYTSILIRASKDLTLKLAKFKDAIELRDFVDKLLTGYIWPTNLVDYIKGFEEQKLNKRFKMKLKYGSDVMLNLEDNMIPTSHVIETLNKNIDKDTGVQRFRSIYVLNELGKFVAVINWVVDYKDRSIMLDILDDKVIDIDNSRFVSDHSLYSRVEQRIIEDIKTKTVQFKNKAS